MASAWIDAGDAPVIPPTSNASIDRIVFQVQRVGGRINDLSQAGNDMVNQIRDRGQNTLDHINTQFSNASRDVNDMVDVLGAKTNNWPVDSLYAVVICGLILIGVGVLFLIIFGVERFCQRRYRVQLVDESDIEKL